VSVPWVKKRGCAVEAEECRSRAGHWGAMVSGYGVRLRIRIYDVTKAGFSMEKYGLGI